MEEKKEHTNNGILSLIFGVMGAILIINWFGIIPNFPPLILGVLAIFFSRKAKKEGDSYGKIGTILGIIATIIGTLTVIAWIIYVYITFSYF